MFVSSQSLPGRVDRNPECLRESIQSPRRSVSLSMHSGCGKLANTPIERGNSKSPRKTCLAFVDLDAKRQKHEVPHKERVVRESRCKSVF